MFAWIKRLWNPKEPEVIEYVTIGPIDNPIVKPNDVNYRFPNPTEFKPPKVVFKNKKLATKKKKK